MKLFRSRSLYVAIAILLIAISVITWQRSKPYTISYAEAADLQQYATPMSLYKRFENMVSGTLNTSTQIPYAIPEDVSIFNSQPTGGVGNNYETVGIFQDVNGDGLPDVIYSKSSNAYVLINNGEGFDIAYYCSKSVSPLQYRGHCAQ